MRTKVSVFLATSQIPEKNLHTIFSRAQPPPRPCLSAFPSAQCLVASAYLPPRLCAPKCPSAHWLESACVHRRSLTSEYDGLGWPAVPSMSRSDIDALRPGWPRSPPPVGGSSSCGHPARRPLGDLLRRADASPSSEPPTSVGGARGASHSRAASPSPPCPPDLAQSNLQPSPILTPCSSASSAADNSPA